MSWLAIMLLENLCFIYSNYVPLLLAFLIAAQAHCQVVDNRGRDSRADDTFLAHNAPAAILFFAHYAPAAIFFFAHNAPAAILLFCVLTK